MIGGITQSAGTPQSPLIGRSKTLTNNSANSIFTFPLASGECESVYFFANILAKKTTDWAIIFLQLNGIFYNDGSSLQFHVIPGELISDFNNLGAVTLTNTGDLTASLSGGVVTVKINPGNVGVTPDSIVLKYIVLQPTGKTITFL